MLYPIIFSVLVVMFILIGFADLLIGDKDEAIKNFGFALFFSIPALLMIRLKSKNKKIAKETNNLFNKRIEKWGLKNPDCYIQIGENALALANDRLHIIDLNKITKTTILVEKILDFKVDLHTNQRNTKSIIALTTTYNSNTIISKVSCSIILNNTNYVFDSEYLGKSTEDIEVKKFINNLERLRLLINKRKNAPVSTPKGNNNVSEKVTLTNTAQVAKEYPLYKDIDYDYCVELSTHAIGLVGNRLHIHKLGKQRPNTYPVSRTHYFRINLHIREGEEIKIKDFKTDLEPNTIVVKVNCKLESDYGMFDFDSNVFDKSMEDTEVATFIQNLKELKSLIDSEINSSKNTVKEVKQPKTINTKKAEEKTQVDQNKTAIEKIKELKELLDINAITQEEFDIKKSELLSKV